MSLAELIVIFLVALVVFGPKQLPLLAKNLSQSMSALQQIKQKMTDFWQEQLNEQQLIENSEKAAEADKLYEK